MNKVKKRLSKEIFLMAVLALSIAIVLIYLGVFKVLNKPGEKPVLTPQETRIINPQLDEEVFDELEKRNY
ncbi:hypothetical protein COS55_00370 [Candidatus Shapirobacteria bacterium CG03_land_8_20_14_0_80_40_19]|uniref:Uncharacterized protein n=1 Tax=Candidatus Shapirobacteria bacterium CG03_land_8_20_14_0_80_40_19 TaxID=1974880 RepID=A0A2M7BG05_9BACT|nr:MAG: hypothetical protein COS55_00370 [Candidatus Shapirobacteria bacterium CG03_land_8_20_14_0_80_40_19]